jgi:hypothetical protein
MSIVVLKLPDVKHSKEERPKACPYCQGETFQHWGQVSKPVKDNRYDIVSVYRYRCTYCRRTFRHYPEGVDRAQQSRRLRKLADMCWALGLSYRGVAGLFAVFELGNAAMIAWRDVQEQAELIRRKMTTSLAGSGLTSGGGNCYGTTNGTPDMSFRV